MENIDNKEGHTWTEVKGKLKEKFASLTNTDLNELKDKQEEILNRMEIKLGQSREEIQRLISTL